METDREVLCWIHARLKRKGDSELVDFMRRLRWIIRAQPKNRISRGHNCNNTNNSGEEFLKCLRNPTDFEIEELT